MSEEIVSPKGDVGDFSVKDLDADALQVLEAAIWEVSREEALRNLLEELKEITEERMMDQLSPEEIEILKDGLVRIFERMIDGVADSESLPDLRELSKQFVERDIAHLRGGLKREGGPDIQVRCV